MPPEDRTRILHMIEAADAVSDFVTGRTRADLDADRMLLFALISLSFWSKRAGSSASSHATSTKRRWTIPTRGAGKMP